MPTTKSPLHLRSSAIALAVLVPLALAASGCGRESASATPREDDAASDAVTAAPPADAAFDSRLDVVDNNGMLRFDGTVDSDAALRAVAEAIAAAYPAGRSTGTVEVDGNARPAPWLRGLAPFLAGLETPGAAVRFRADAIELSGQVRQEDRLRLARLARAQFPGMRLTGLFEGVDDGDDPATAALAALHPASPAHGVESALNRTSIAFEPGSARIEPASLAVIAKAGQILAAMPADRRIEIAGHAAGNGGADADAALSRQRAEAVKVQLIVNGVAPGAIDTRAAADAAGHRDGVTFRVLN